MEGLEETTLGGLKRVGEGTGNKSRLLLLFTGTYLLPVARTSYMRNKYLIPSVNLQDLSPLLYIKCNMFSRSISKSAARPKAFQSETIYLAHGNRRHRSGWWHVKEAIAALRNRVVRIPNLSN